MSTTAQLVSPKLKNKGLFIVWGAFQGSRRSEQLARKFQIDLEYIYFTNKRGLLYAPFKYLYQAMSTLILLFRRKPELVFIQNPPTFAPIFVYLYCLLFKAQYVIDTHTGALIYPQWRWTIPLQRFLSRHALTTVVTNRQLAEVIADWDAPAFVMEDPPMVIDPPEPMALPDSAFRTVLVSVAYPDEPVAEVVAVARNLPDIDFYITGDFTNNLYFKEVVENAPANVHFPGFMRDTYFSLLAACDVIICLTTDDFTFQSGANEALWLGKPLITSDWPVLREYFNQGTCHVDNSVEAIEKALRDMRANITKYQAEMVDLQTKRNPEWYQKANALIDMV